MRQQGFTLLEMMVVLAIISVLLFVAYPVYRGFLQRTESWSVQKHIAEAVRTARVEAQIRSKDTIICLTDSSWVCDKAGQHGIMVFVDERADSQFDDKDIVVYREPLSLKYGRIAMHAGGRSYMKVMGDSALPRGHFGHIRYCSESDEKAYSYKMTFNEQGTLRQDKGNVKKVEC